MEISPKLIQSQIGKYSRLIRHFYVFYKPIHKKRQKELANILLYFLEGF